MKLRFRQRAFSWLDSYDIFDTAGNAVYRVKGELALAHRLAIYDARGEQVGTVAQRLLTFLPKFEIYKGSRYMGCLKKELSLFVPRYSLDYKDWYIEGSILEWDYQILDRSGRFVASIQKELFRLTDTYVLDIADPQDALDVLMFVLAMDAEKCSRN